MKRLSFIVGIAVLFAFFSLVQAATTKPDLIVDSISFWPLQPAVDQLVTITISGRYEGETVRTSSKGFVNIDKKFTGFSISGGGQGLTVPFPSLLNPMQPGTNFAYVYDGVFVLGTHNLKFTMDFTDEIDEADETNNTVQTTVMVAGLFDLPNLEITDFDVPANIVEGEEVTITVSGVYIGSESLISDQGLSTFTTAFEDFDIVSTSAPQPAVHAPLTSGSSFMYSLLGTFTASGPKTLTFTVDTNNNLYESNEGDNMLTVTVGVNAKAPEEPVEPTEPEKPTEPEEPTIAPNEWTASEKALVTEVDSVLTARLLGQILLQTEEHGEAWYVLPDDSMKYYMKDGAVAYEMLRAFGLGITDADLVKIPVGIEDRFEDTDTDGDGLPDKLEEGLKTDPEAGDTDGDGISDGVEVLTNNTNPLGSGNLTYDQAVVNRLSGRILLQVESRGEAWYVNPDDGKRYYMKDGNAAYQIMRFLSLGITNTDLRKIGVGVFVPVD